jgi:hypothetical protein
MKTVIFHNMLMQYRVNVIFILSLTVQKNSLAIFVIVKLFV